MGPPNLPSPLQQDMQPVCRLGDTCWWPVLDLRGTLHNSTQAVQCHGHERVS